MLTALDQWAENRKPPERIIASHRANGKVDRTANFTCESR
jgi:hypothetical protein